MNYESENRKQLKSPKLAQNICLLWSRKNHDVSCAHPELSSVEAKNKQQKNLRLGFDINEVQIC